jgi:putative pyruvate formate lyase activating enzyme
VGPHFGEEPPIVGENGSGTVFLTGCSLRCSFCQNHQISHQGLGRETTSEDLLKEIKGMIRKCRVHNINFVTPDHFFPHVLSIVSSLRRRFDIPMVFNLSGYQTLESLKGLQDHADIYLPDFKYSDPRLAAALSACPDYSGVAIEAIAEMVRQKGFIDSVEDRSRPARQGVLVRHLILPGKIGNSLNALTTLFVEFGGRLPLSLMSQYHPVVRHEDPDLNRFLAPEEFERVYSHALSLGFENLFVQFPEKAQGERHSASPLLPDFRRARPFG